MTVPANDGIVQHVASGSSPNFPIPFPFLSPQELEVAVTAPDGAVSILTFGVTFQITGTPDTDGTYMNGATAVLATIPAAGSLVTIRRKTNLTQEAEYGTADKFPARQHERALDKLTLILQEIARNTLGALTIPFGLPINFDTELPPPEPLKLLGWRADGNGLANFTGGEFDAAIEAANVAAAAAAAAETGANEAKDLAEAAQIAAETAAAAAEAAAASLNLPSAAGQGSNYLRQKEDESGLEYRTPAQMAADIEPHLTFPPADGTLLNVIVLTQSATYIPTAGANRAFVRGQGAGGGGGGASGGSGQGGGGGGGSGGYFEGWLDLTGVTSVACTIGSGGAGGSAGANAGFNGGTTSFGTYASATGGHGGAAGTNTTGTAVRAGGAAGTASSNLVNGVHFNGQNGHTARVYNGAAVNWGHGGNSVLGLGGVFSYDTNSDGVPGTGFGSGGSGAWAAGSARAGSSGRPGVIIIYEYKMGA